MCDHLVDSIASKTHALFGGAMASAIVPAAKHHARLLLKLRYAQETGTKRAIRAAQHRVLTSKASMTVCLIRALKTKNGWTWESLIHAAGVLTPFADPGETVV